MMVLFIAGCSSDSKPPSCQQALAHYYGAGCSYFDASREPPPAIPQSAMLNFCQTAAVQAPESCQDELDVWLECNAAVPDQATSNADCDCSADYMALLRCG